MRRWLDDHITRGALGYFVMGLIVLCGAVWSFGALVEIGNIAAKGIEGGTGPLTTLQPPVAGFLFAGSVDLFIFYGYLKCYGPTWQISLSVFHILVGLATSVGFQLAHALGHVDPVAVSVVPPIAVAVSLDTWVVSQVIDWRKRSKELPRVRSHTVMAGPGGPTAAVDTGGADVPSPTTPPVSEPVPVPVSTKGLSKADRQAIYRAKTLATKKGEDVAAAVEQVISLRNIDRSLVTQNGTKP